MKQTLAAAAVAVAVAAAMNNNTDIGIDSDSDNGATKLPVAGKENNIIILICSQLSQNTRIFLSASCRARKLIHFNNIAIERER